MAHPLLSGPSSDRSVPLPPGAKDYLVPDNPRLQELEARYAAFEGASTDHALWTSDYTDAEVELAWFRGDSAYVWHHRDRNTEAKIVLCSYYCELRQLWRGMEEDGQFGVWTVNVDDQRRVSRDLIDAAVELDFLDRQLGLERIQDWNILDIGAGYGRFAHRYVTATPEGRGRVLATDGVALSTFLAEYYLDARGAGPRAQAVPVDEVAKALATGDVKLATNIHSFSECSLAAVQWWLDLLAEHRVPYLFVAPNADNHKGTRMLTTEADDESLDFRAAIEARGYVLEAQSPKFLAKHVQRHGVSPTHHYLFKLS